MGVQNILDLPLDGVWLYSISKCDVSFLVTIHDYFYHTYKCLFISNSHVAVFYMFLIWSMNFNFSLVMVIGHLLSKIYVFFPVLFNNINNKSLKQFFFKNYFENYALDKFVDTIDGKNSNLYVSIRRLINLHICSLN